METFKLYGTSACHLCEIAQAMITAHTDQDLDVMEVDISDSDTLFERYGLRIPVLQHPDGRELDWPFTEVGLQGFFAS
ncbi:MAG: glutaredoxin family protein [Halioglobus sp.]|nr:glutaredoxin family protein [Halioglobus sp.]